MVPWHHEAEDKVAMLEEVDVDIDGRADCGQQAGQVACTFLKTELKCFDSRRVYFNLKAIF